MSNNLSIFLILAWLLATGGVAVAEEQQPERPCREAPELAQFDFWVGRWDVHIAAGRKAGVNEITKEQGGCVLVERWTSAAGGTGTSMNYFEPGTGQWIQNWVGADGSVIDIRGGLQEDGSMLLVGTLAYVGKDGSKPFRGRWTLLEDGRVSQFFEQSDDDGETWAEWFLGYYSRQSQSAD